MTTQHNERRRDAGGPNTNRQPMSDIVTRSLLVQRRTGTIGAIEYLKGHDVQGAVIQRVLGGAVMRTEDARALREIADGAAA
jgi:hypothetical protein